MTLPHYRKALRLLAAVLTLAVFVACASPSLWAFTCHKGARGPLTFEIAKLDALTVEGQVYRPALTITNASDRAIKVDAVFSSIESVYLYDETGADIAPPNAFTRSFVIEPNSTFKSDVPFAVRGAYRDAHYPIRANFSFKDGENTECVELRPVYATDLKEFLPQSKELQVLKLKKNSFLNLSGSNITDFAPYWKRFDVDGLNELPIGWSGVEPDVKCSYNATVFSRGGVSRSCWSIHPPYAGGSGVIGLRFAVELPAADEIELRFFRAMRDITEKEPPTDGVIFRVYASVLGDSNEFVSKETLAQALSVEPNVQDMLLNEQYAGTTWSEANVDLSKFAGKTLLITFETDPGAKRDTTCDGSFWGDVALMADPQDVVIATDVERDALRKKNSDAFALFAANPEKFYQGVQCPSEGVDIDAVSRGFELDDGQFAVVTLGYFGVCDGFVTIGTPEKYVQIDGVRAQYQGINVGYERPLAACNVIASFVPGSELEKTARQFAYAHKSEIIGDLPNDANFDEEDLADVKVQEDPENTLACFIGKTKAGLAFRFIATNNVEIESLQFGPMSEKAARVYFGQGHCIVEPTKPFSFTGDGFGCASSHVGFDFRNGISLLQATTRALDTFVVNPDLNVYTLTTCPDSRLTIRTSDKGALDCAMKYAPGFDKNAAPLVPKKAGLFVFDYWGGSYIDVLNRIKLYVDYGLTDSMLIQHVWQHYGYDVRLPDIWPPRTEQGSLEDLKATQEFCDTVGIPFGLHDNYIDFYPDADGFSYDQIIFNPNGLPQKAWYNPGPEVQSYRFNPNSIWPYVKRNMELIRKDLMQTAYFTDVFSSIHAPNFFDKEGNFHSRAETIDNWNKFFDYVRDAFNGNAITVSESGNDALTGSLDGADAILRRVTTTQENYSVVIECEDSEYVPWADAVTHDRFILHGVGYSGRYQGGISRGLRGIESDDYLSAEALTGHALMVDLETSTRGTVRKYWLMQNLARSLAMNQLIGFEFVGEGVHRQKISWSSGVDVYVNRGDDDWTLEEVTFPGSNKPIVLPRFGFWSVNQEGSSFGGVVRIGNQIVELRVDGENYFVNGRQTLSNQVTPIRPTYEDVKILDSNALEGNMVWDAYRPTDQPYAPFLHLERPQTWWNDKPELYVLPLKAPNKPSNEWNGRETGLFGGKVVVKVPEELPAGYYNLLCGLYDVGKTGRRLPLLGSGTHDLRYRLGMIAIEGNGKDRTLSFEPAPKQHDADMRLVPNYEPTNFGFCKTNGGYRLEQKTNASVVLTPLPNEPAFEVELTTPFFTSGKFAVIERDRQGTELARYEIIAENGATKLTLDSSKVFSCELIKE